MAVTTAFMLIFRNARHWLHQLPGRFPHMMTRLLAAIFALNVVCFRRTTVQRHHGNIGKWYIKCLITHAKSINLCHFWWCCKAPVTQNSTSKSRTRSYENLVDVVVSGNFWSILAWSCFVTGYGRRRLFHGWSTAQALPKHGKIYLSVISRLTHAISRDTNA